MSRDRLGRWDSPDTVTNALIADVLRAAAAGRAANGDMAGARRLRADARRLERRDGAGHRKHVRTRLAGT